MHDIVNVLNTTGLYIKMVNCHVKFTSIVVIINKQLSLTSLDTSNPTCLKQLINWPLVTYFGQVYPGPVCDCEVCGLHLSHQPAGVSEGTSILSPGQWPHLPRGPFSNSYEGFCGLDMELPGPTTAPGCGLTVSLKVHVLEA